jgi:hypothetical protein
MPADAALLIRAKLEQYAAEPASLTNTMQVRRPGSVCGCEEAFRTSFWLPMTTTLLALVDQACFGQLASTFGY